MKDCRFCTILKDKTNTLYQDTNFAVIWDQLPATPGHALVIPLRHIQFFPETTEQERTELLQVVIRAINIIKQTNLKQLYQRLLSDPINDMAITLYQQAIEALEITQRAPDAYNHGLNDGPAAGQTIPHLHYHIMPRWIGDVEHPEGGIRRLFPHDAYSIAKANTKK